MKRLICPTFARGAFYLSGTLFFLSTAIAPVSPAHACNGSCDYLALILVGAPSALGTTIVAPLVGLGIDKASDGEDSPYWTAVGFTLVASSAGAWIAFQRYDEVSSSRAIVESIAFPVVLGSVATVLVYTLWPRSNDTASKEFNQNVPQIAFTPTKDGGFIGFSWQF